MIESWAEFENGCVPLQLRRAGGTLMSATFHAVIYDYLLGSVNKQLWF